MDHHKMDEIDSIKYISSLLRGLSHAIELMKHIYDSEAAQIFNKLAKLIEASDIVVPKKSTMSSSESEPNTS